MMPEVGSVFHLQTVCILITATTVYLKQALPEILKTSHTHTPTAWFHIITHITKELNVLFLRTAEVDYHVPVLTKTYFPHSYYTSVWVATV